MDRQETKQRWALLRRVYQDYKNNLPAVWLPASGGGGLIITGPTVETMIKTGLLTEQGQLTEDGWRRLLIGHGAEGYTDR